MTDDLKKKAALELADLVMENAELKKQVSDSRLYAIKEIQKLEEKLEQQRQLNKADNEALAKAEAGCRQAQAQLQECRDFVEWGAKRLKGPRGDQARALKEKMGWT